MPFREVDLLFDVKSSRFRNAFNVLQFLVMKGEIQKNKGWYDFKGKKYREKDLMEVFESDAEVENSLRENLGISLNEEILL